MADNVETEVVEENLEEATTEETQEDTKASFLETIKEKIKSFTSNDEEVTEVVVPDDFSKAALNAGWSSEDIDSFAKDYTEDQLREMIPTLNGEDSEQSEETLDTPKEETTETKDEDSQEDEKTKKLLARIEALEKAQSETSEEAERKELYGLIQKASQAFDALSDELEVFGKTEDLPRFPDGKFIRTSPQMKARIEVFDLARTLKGTGMDFDTALSVSLNAFKGKNLESDVKRNLIKDLKKKEKRLSGKRTSHDSGTKEMTGPEVIRAVLAKHNR